MLVADNTTATGRTAGELLKLTGSEDDDLVFPTGRHLLATGSLDRNDAVMHLLWI